MTLHEVEARVHDYQELKRMREALDAELAAVEDSIKNEMTVRDTCDMVAGCFRVRWTAYTTSRIDTAAIKRIMPELAERFTKTTEARRFSIN
ncbi:hypothetical protein AGMMS49992_14830 [Clostridia bacterium]|nr:hypothetical protein AGMMS49992_14830 [Clostridia bacterium]